jgi:hypothetical protein
MLGEGWVLLVLAMRLNVCCEQHAYVLAVDMHVCGECCWEPCCDWFQREW